MNDVPTTEFYLVRRDFPGQVGLEKMPDIQSVLELGPGEYAVKPVDKEGCWMDACLLVIQPPSTYPWLSELEAARVKD